MTAVAVTVGVVIGATAVVIGVFASLIWLAIYLER